LLRPVTGRHGLRNNGASVRRQEITGLYVGAPPEGFCAPTYGRTVAQGLGSLPSHPVAIQTREGAAMNSIVYIVGAIVIIVAILSFFGLR